MTAPKISPSVAMLHRISATEAEARRASAAGRRRYASNRGKGLAQQIRAALAATEAHAQTAAEATALGLDGPAGEARALAAAWARKAAEVTAFRDDRLRNRREARDRAALRRLARAAEVEAAAGDPDDNSAFLRAARSVGATILFCTSPTIAPRAEGHLG